MKTRSIYVSVLVGAAAAIGGTVAIAQPAEGAASGESAPAGQSADTKNLSPEEVLEESRFTVDRMEATADNISRMLRIAREEKDVVKTLCLDDKLNQIDVAVRSAGDRLAIIEAAVKGNSTERLEHDSAVLGALGSRASELSVEANQCIGEDAAVASDSELNVVFDPAIPEGETSQDPTTVIISSPPVAASPTL